MKIGILTIGPVLRSPLCFHGASSPQQIFLTRQLAWQPTRLRCKTIFNGSYQLFLTILPFKTHPVFNRRLTSRCTKITFVSWSYRRGSHRRNTPCTPPQRYDLGHPPSTPTKNENGRNTRRNRTTRSIYEPLPPSVPSNWY